MSTDREPINPKISMWHFLAYYLRYWREREKLSQTQWGGIIGAAKTSVSNMEAARHHLQEDQARRIDLKYGTGGLFEFLVWFARRAHNPDWGRQLVSYEEQAYLVRMFHGHVIPAALQTDDYTWAYVQVSTTRDFEAQMARRTARKQAFLARGDEVEFRALIHEAVLATVVGGKTVMREQLEHLERMAAFPHVSVRVVPFSSGAHLGAEGPLWVLSLDGRDVAYSGAQKGGRLIETPGEVRELSNIFDLIGAKAASEDASLDLIGKYREQYT